MKRQSLIISMIFFLLCSLACADAFAKTKRSSSGLDAYVNLGPSFSLFTKEVTDRTLRGESRETTHYDEWFIGGNANINIGYRVASVLGIYLSQDLGFSKLYDNNDPENTFSFLGGTYLMAKVMLGSDNASFNFGFGLGAMYDNTKDKKYYIIANESRVSFAMKLTLDFTYYIMGFIGIGIDFTYNVGIMEWDNGGRYIYDDYDSSRSGYEYEMQSKIHQLLPGLHVSFRL